VDSPGYLPTPHVALYRKGRCVDVEEFVIADNRLERLI